LSLVLTHRFLRTTTQQTLLHLEAREHQSMKAVAARLQPGDDDYDINTSKLSILSF